MNTLWIVRVWIVALIRSTTYSKYWTAGRHNDQARFLSTTSNRYVSYCSNIQYWYLYHTEFSHNFLFELVKMNAATQRWPMVWYHALRLHGVCGRILIVRLDRSIILLLRTVLDCTSTRTRTALVDYFDPSFELLSQLIVLPLVQKRCPNDLEVAFQKSCHIQYDHVESCRNNTIIK